MTAGTIRPGDTGGAAAGALSFTSSLTFDPPPPPSGSVSTVAELTIFGVASADKILINGDLTLDQQSRLVVNLDAAYTPAEGHTWDLIDWAGLLTLNGFDAGGVRDGTADDLTNLDLPELGEGLTWNISNFTGNGALTLTIAAIPEPSRALLTAAGLAALLLRRRRL